MISDKGVFVVLIVFSPVLPLRLVIGIVLTVHSGQKLSVRGGLERRHRHADHLTTSIGSNGCQRAWWRSSGSNSPASGVTISTDATRPPTATTNRSSVRRGW
jgi:hypothetical protein